MAKRALFLVRDTTGVAALASRLASDFEFELWANEEAGQALAYAGLAFQPVHAAEAAERVAQSEVGVSVVVANFYAVETVGRSFMSWKSALAAFDRSIVETVRSAAWAAERVAVVGRPEEYGPLLNELAARGGKTSQPYRTRQAAAALRAASEYDFAVAQYLEIHGGEAPDMGALGGYPHAIRFAWPRAQTLDAGENPHQRAALYGSFGDHFEQIAGDPLDYESIVNISRATHLIGEFERPAAAVAQNGRITAVANAGDVGAAVDALLAEPRHPGFWIVANGAVGAERIAALRRAGAGGLLLPDAQESERAALSDSDSQLRAVVSKSGLGYEALQELRSVVGGALVQDKDRAPVNPFDWTVQSLNQPLVEDWEPLVLAAKVARHLDSCACVCMLGAAIAALEWGRASPIEAWEGIERRAAALEGALVVFDQALASDGPLERLWRAGARLALCPSGGNDEALRAKANDLGLTLMTLPRSLRRLG